MTLYDTDLFQEVGLNDGPNGGQEVPASGRVRARIQVGATLNLDNDECILI